MGKKKSAKKPPPKPELLSAKKKDREPPSSRFSHIPRKVKEAQPHTAEQVEMYANELRDIERRVRNMAEVMEDAELPFVHLTTQGLITLLDTLDRMTINLEHKVRMEARVFLSKQTK